MATVYYGQVNPGRYAAGSTAHYAVLQEELSRLKAGDTFTATFPGKYSATCARNALTLYCRNKLLYQVESHQRGNVLEIKRTK
ncbi:MAG TPA: hypothetical protein VGQ12_07495 [Candidatus Angelobacter sp.]|jgi:hypothetical protein|nr:hypothetical protein [Candidatus Angelobacter sp.]